MERDDKIAVLAAIEERKRRQRACPLMYFEPHEKQKEFLGTVRGYRIAWFLGGNRVGKTTINAVLTLCHAYGYWIFEALQDGACTLTDEGDYPPRSQVPPKYWIRRKDGVPLRPASVGLAITGLAFPKGIGAILWPELQAWLPPATLRRLEISRGVQSTPTRIAHPDGLWTIYFGSGQQESMQYEGIKVDWLAMDEPVPRGIFTAAWRGCIDYVAPVWGTMTPLGANCAWVYREHIAGGRDDVGHISACQEDNPYLSAEALAEFREGSDFSEEELLARTRGEFGFLTFRAFPQFRKEQHVIEAFKIPSHWPRICACDPASRRPFYFLWLAYDQRRETWIAYREFPDAQLHHTYRTSPWAIGDYATIIRNLEGTERISARVVDPRFGPAEYSVKGERTTSVCDDFDKYGLHFDPRVPDTGSIETGLERVRGLLRYDVKREITPGNRPHLLITEDCPSLIFAMENYAFVPPNARDDNILPDKTAELGKDPIDALRYAVLYGAPAVDAPTNYISDRDWERANAIDDSWI